MKTRALAHLVFEVYNLMIEFSMCSGVETHFVFVELHALYHQHNA